MDIAKHIRESRGHTNFVPISGGCNVKIRNLSFSSDHHRTIVKKWKRLIKDGDITEVQYDIPRSCGKCKALMPDAIEMFRHIRHHHQRDGPVNWRIVVRCSVLAPCNAATTTTNQHNSVKRWYNKSVKTDSWQFYCITAAQDCLLKFNFFIMDFAEEIPLLDLEIPLSLDPADVPKFYEAFKQFDVQNTGFVLISVR